MGENTKFVYRNLPNFIRFILKQSDGWLVGKAVENLMEGNAVKDYDIVIPDRELFQNTVNILYRFTEGHIDANTWGGMKFVAEGYTIDIWCEELAHFISNASHIGFIYNLKKQKLLTNG